MKKLWLDIETFCELDLTKCGVYTYSRHPSFEILMVAWALDDGPVEIYTGDRVLDVPYLDDPEVLKVAHNAQFERVCYSAALGLPEGEFLDPNQWHDTMAQAAVAGFPQALGKLAKAIGAELKDEAGTSLINTFSKLRRGKRILPEDEPEKWQEFKDYCVQDVVSMRDIASMLPDMPESELEYYRLDQRINDRGMLADVDMAIAARDADELNRREAGDRMIELLGIENPGSVPQVSEGLRRLGVDLPDLRAATIAEAIEEASGDALEALQLRQLLALVAARKYQAIIDTAGKDGRVRGGFRFFGAHTGRWSSRGVQLQNLPRADLDVDPRLVILDLKLGNRVSSNDLKALVRPVFLGPLTVVDYASIEARVLAWLAGEQWVLEAFEAGRDIYVETAKRMSTEDRELTRQQGKVAVLALGYQGGVAALRGMGAEGDDSDLQDLVKRWRKANRRIRRLWHRIEEIFPAGGRAGRLQVEVDGKDRALVLPSGRSIIYRKVSFKGGITFSGSMGRRTDTYGGRLIENATQAVSRDLLAAAMKNMDEQGIRVVGHVHDEIILEDCSVELAEKIMCQPLEWTKGLPLDAEGFVTDRYRKG